MINDFDCDAAGFWFGERSRRIAVEGSPGILVNLGFERGLERLVGVIRTKKVGVTDEEALFVVVGVDKPAGDAFGPVAADFTGVGVEDVDAVDFDLDLSVFSIKDVDVGFTEDDEQVAFTGVLEIISHVQVGVHSGLEYMDATQFIKLG